MQTLTIFDGHKTPIKVKGVNQCHLISFAYKYPGWHSYKENRATLNAIRSLEAKGYIETNRNKQFRFKRIINHE